MRENAKRTDQLAPIAELAANDRIQINVESVLPLRDAQKAQELSQNGHTRGKIVLTMEP